MGTLLAHTGAIWCIVLIITIKDDIDNVSNKTSRLHCIAVNKYMLMQ